MFLYLYHIFPLLIKAERFRQSCQVLRKQPDFIFIYLFILLKMLGYSLTTPGGGGVEITNMAARGVLHHIRASQQVERGGSVTRAAHLFERHLQNGEALRYKRFPAALRHTALCGGARPCQLCRMSGMPCPGTRPGTLTLKQRRQGFLHAERQVTKQRGE